MNDIVVQLLTSLKNVDTRIKETFEEYSKQFHENYDNEIYGIKEDLASIRKSILELNEVYTRLHENDDIIALAESIKRLSVELSQRLHDFDQRLITLEITVFNLEKKFDDTMEKKKDSPSAD